jgi:hypothetical protein
VNLRTTEGDLFTVAARHVDNAPNTLVVVLFPMFWELNAG